MLKGRSFGLSIVLISSLFSAPAQVNFQTGSAVFSLPMFNWQDDKSRLSSVVALSYNSGSGLKVNDVASNVGQGWNLIAGGVITRMQVGEPDDQRIFNGTSGTDQDVTKFPAGMLYTTIPAANGCPVPLTRYPTYGAQNILYAQKQTVAMDRQLDYFTFQFNGKSGMFILDTAGGDHGIPLGDTKLKISFQRDENMRSSGIRTTITSFTITDVDGTIYKFTKHGLTKLLIQDFCTANTLISLTQPKIQNAHRYCQSAFDWGPTGGEPTPWVNGNMAYPYIISDWYLTEVDDPFVSTRKITLAYDDLNLTVSAGTDISYNHSLNDYIVISYKKSLMKECRLNSITYPDGHLVTINYATTSRFDYPGQNAVSSIDIKYNGRFLSKYQLNTSYFVLNRYGNPTTASEKFAARLCLKSVKKIGVDLKEDTPPYIFDYYKGSNNPDDFVPPPFFYVKDIWGYYNGNNSLLSTSPLSGLGMSPVRLDVMNPYDLDFTALKGLCFQNDNVVGSFYNAKPGYAQNGLLKQIIYPTGGSLTYQYVQNTAGNFVNGTTAPAYVGGVHVSQTSSVDGGYSNGCATPVATNYNYVVNGTGSASSMWGLEVPVNSINNSNNWQEEKKSVHFSWTNWLGTCLWHYVYPGIQSQYEAVNMDTWQKIMTALSPVLGVLSIIGTIDDIATLLSETAWGAIVDLIVQVITAALTYIISCPRQTKFTPNIVFYNFDLNEVSPLPAQFKQVEVTESSGAIGKTVQKFTHGDPLDPGGPDYPLWSPSTNLALSTKQRFAPWAYGLPKLTTVYDASGNKITETQNIYDFSFAKRSLFDPVGGTMCGHPGTGTWLFTTKCQVVNSFSERADWWTSQAITYLTSTPTPADILVDIDSLFTGRAQLKTTYERTYRVADPSNYVQKQTDYTYNTADCDLLTNYSSQGNYDVNTVTTTQSNGDVNTKYIKYPTDFNTGILGTMVQKNIVSLPVSTYTSVVKSGSPTTQFLNEKVTEFTQLSNLDIKPSRIIEQRFATPPSGLTAYSGPTTTNYALYKIPQQFSYDVNGNLTGLKDEGSRSVANIYDYNDKYIVASVINADPALDKSAFTSFESQDLSRSGWVLTGAAAYNLNVSSATGSNTFTLQASSANALTASSLNTTRPYILSFWASNANVSVVGGATLVKSAPTYNGFTYYEYNIALGTTSVVVKNLTATAVNIDELRLYPKSARMRTTTYDPLIGKTSECDENNRITFYVYDNLGRLRFTEDEQKNVLKMYEYNNVSSSKQTGCPTTFSNLMVSELFSRSNCTAGYQGDTVSYTVAAGTYTSNSSQYDADIQAELTVLINGQTYANAHAGCLLIYHNTVQSVTDTTQGCPAGQKGGLVTYTVPASTYSSVISQADADQMASDEIYANAQAYANSVAHSVCLVDTAQDWEWFAGDEITPADSSYCLTVGGALPAHLFQKATDVNPNSPTFNQHKWLDTGPSSDCPSNLYYNSMHYQVFQKSCGVGFIGTNVTYIVPPGKYSSSTSQAAADLLATNDITANGQNYANTNGSCMPATITITYSNAIAKTFPVSFTNVTTHIVYNFTANPSTSGTLGTVPNGTYNISACPAGGTGTYTYSIYGFFASGVTCGNFSNVPVTSNGVLVIH